MRLPEDFRHYFERAPLRHLTRLAQFVALYAAAAFWLVWLSELGQSPWRSIAMLPLYVLAAGALHGVSLFTHEGVHGTLSLHPLVNRLLAAGCAWPVLQNFSAYRVLHLRHHAALGEAEDPDHYANYTRWTFGVAAMHWARLLVGYPAYIVAIPVLALLRGSCRERIWITTEVLSVGVASLLLSHALPWTWLFHGWFVPMLFVNVIVNVRGMSQHTLLPEPSHPLRGSRTISAGPLVAFFMCNENFHLEHHLYPGVPWYNLPRLHAALREQLVSAQAPFIRSYWQFVSEFVHRPGQKPGTLSTRAS
jgi:fatty acid desaturase